MCAERELLLTQTTLTISTFEGWWGVMSKDLQGTPELGQLGFICSDHVLALAASR
jgi:hypothetical protein